MRWQEINEVVDDREWPVLDHITIDILHEKYKRFENLQKVSSIQGFDLVADEDEWPISSDMCGSMFIVHDDEPIAFFDIIHNSRDNTVTTPFPYISAPYRQKGLGYQFYKFLLDSGYTIRSGKSHSQDSIKLWNKISRNYVVLYQGKRYNGNLPYDGTRERFIAHK